MHRSPSCRSHRLGGAAGITAAVAVAGTFAVAGPLPATAHPATAHPAAARETATPRDTSPPRLRDIRFSRTSVKVRGWQSCP